jgi:hypothetical protein
MRTVINAHDDLPVLATHSCSLLVYTWTAG